VGQAGSDAKDGDMETSVNRIGTGLWPAANAAPPPPPPAPREAPTAPPPSIELGAWFDRNGDGHIDTATWVMGGDAYLRVDQRVSEVLDRSIVRPRDRVARANETAADSYRRYGGS
jgi:hypothetical protein